MLSEDVDLAKVWEAVGECSYVFMPFCLFLRFASCRAVLAIVAFLFLFHLLSMVFFLFFVFVCVASPGHTLHKSRYTAPLAHRHRHRRCFGLDKTKRDEVIRNERQ